MSYYSSGQYTASNSIETENVNDNISTKLVIVKSKTSSHPYFGLGSSKGYFIDGKESPSLTLQQNVVYRFDQSDTSNSNHRIQFFTDANKVNSYQTNISEVGTAGSTGAYTEITLTSDTPVEIFYQCQNHHLMGGNLKSSTSGNDTLKNSSNHELLDAGAGLDTATYTGKFSDYSFKRTSTSLELTDQREGINDGNDTLINFEYLQFSDQIVEESKVDITKTYSGKFSDYKFFNKGNGTYQIKTDSGYDDITGLPLLTFTEEATTSSFRDISAIVDIKGVFDQVTGLNTDNAKMFRLYNAAFKRLPDPDGLKYWISKYSSGENDERSVASSFLESAEFKERYGDNVSNSTYVNTLYKNVLERDADIEGFNYWLGQLDSGAEARYEVLLGFSESIENKTLFTEITGFE
tara:strand:- start:360 stop:1580 length:1221 start_codon:yes stop_codon:yes gene_type:complete